MTTRGKTSSELLGWLRNAGEEGRAAGELVA